MLLYLEGIARSGGASPVRDSMLTESAFDPNDPQLAKLNAYRNSGYRSSRLSQSHHAGENDLEDLARSEMSYDKVDREEVASNVQEGQRSEIARSEGGQVRIFSMGLSPDLISCAYRSIGNTVSRITMNLGPKMAQDRSTNRMALPLVILARCLEIVLALLSPRLPYVSHYFSNTFSPK